MGWSQKEGGNGKFCPQKRPWKLTKQSTGEVEGPQGDSVWPRWEGPGSYPRRGSHLAPGQCPGWPPWAHIRPSNWPKIGIFWDETPSYFNNTYTSAAKTTWPWSGAYGWDPETIWYALWYSQSLWASHAHSPKMGLGDPQSRGGRTTLYPPATCMIILTI